MQPDWRHRLADVVVIGLIILALMGAAAPDYYRVRDVRASRDLLRQLNDAQQQFQAANPHLGYACNLDDLAEAGLLAPSLTDGSTDSYVIHLNCRGRRRLGPHSSYRLFLRPKYSDRPYLCTDESGVVATDRWNLTKCFDSLLAQRSPEP
jgi:type II secretory pathway pseudopilin PulG